VVDGHYAVVLGPPLIDRGFRLTGGQCALSSPEARAEMGDARKW
jgi:hypothetical protein